MTVYYLIFILSLAAEMTMFVKKLPYWIDNAMGDSPEHLLNKKNEGTICIIYICCQYYILDVIVGTSE